MASASTATTTNSKKQLLDLPNEILDDIVFYVSQETLDSGDFHFSSISLLALSWTCRQLYNHASPRLPNQHDKLTNFRNMVARVRTAPLRLKVPRKQLREEMMPFVDALTLMERWPSYDPLSYDLAVLPRVTPEGTLPSSFGPKIRPHPLYLCTRCIRLRPISKFLIPQVTNSNGKYPRQTGQFFEDIHWHSSNSRFCVECGISEQLYTPNTGSLRYYEDGEVKNGMICDRCKKWTKCDKASMEAVTGTCRRCLAYRPRGKRKGAAISAATSRA